MRIQKIYKGEIQKIIDKNCDEMIQKDKMNQIDKMNQKEEKRQDSLEADIQKENEENTNGSNQKEEISNPQYQQRGQKYGQQNLKVESLYGEPANCDSEVNEENKNYKKDCNEFFFQKQQNNEELTKCKIVQTNNQQKQNNEEFSTRIVSTDNYQKQNTEELQIVQTGNQQKNKIFSRIDFLTSKIKKGLKNKKLISTDFTIEVVAALEELLKNINQNQIKKCIELIQEKKIQQDNSKQQKIDSKIKRKFQVFLEKKYYDLENFKTKTFKTNIFNIIAVRLVEEDKKKCTQKLKECYSQLSKNWINLLDFKVGKYKEYFSILQQVKELLKNQGISLGTDLKEYFLHKNYATYNFLEITQKLLQILTIYQDEKIFELLDGIVQMKLDKYKSKRAINFNKKNIINLIYDDNGEIDYNVKQEIKEIIEESDNYQNYKLQN